MDIVVLTAWQQAHEIVRGPVRHVDPPLDALATFGNRLDIALQVAEFDMAGDVGQRPAAVAGYQVEDCLGRWRKAAYDQVFVQEDGADLRALERCCAGRLWRG
jgi:hypothetical protein